MPHEGGLGCQEVEHADQECYSLALVGCEGLTLACVAAFRCQSFYADQPNL